MRRYLMIALPFLASWALAASPARAVVVDLNPALSGQGTVPFSAAAGDDLAGVALIPGTRISPDTTARALKGIGVPRVVSGGCIDPALAPNLVLASTALCYHRGSVLHRNETFVLTWDALRRYWSGTRNYLEQFQRDVADGSGSLTSPFAVTSQYTDSTGRAQNQSKYGGGCIDYGNPDQVSNRNTTCLFGSSVQTGPGYNYPGNGCSVTGSSFTGTGTTGFSSNDVCLTDAQIKAEVVKIVKQMGIVNRTQPGYEPMVVVPLPARVESCLSGDARLCSVNGSLTPPPPTVAVKPDARSKLKPGTYSFEITYVLPSGQSLPSAAATVTVSKPSDITISSPTIPGVTSFDLYATSPGGVGYMLQGTEPLDFDNPFIATVPGPPPPPPPPFFCSYHSQVNVNGTDVAYVVQPWTAMTTCDEAGAPTPPPTAPPDVLSADVGAQMVSPLSQAEIAAITDPHLNGWFALDGSEINDNGESDVNNNGACIPLGSGLDTVKVGEHSYVLQREWNNGADIESDPMTYFGCAPMVILKPAVVVPSPIDQGEVVSFDGSATASTLVVPNGSYTWSFGDGTTGSGPSVVHSFAHAGFYNVTMTVTDRGGNTRSITQPIEVLQADGQPPAPGNQGGGAQALKVRLQLMPQSLGSVLRSGLAMRVRSNEAANGFVTLSIFRSAAHRAHLSRSGKPDSLVVIGRGTVSGIKHGTVSVRVRVASATARKLAHAGHLTLTLHMTLYAKNGGRATASAVGRY